MAFATTLYLGYDGNITTKPTKRIASIEDIKSKNVCSYPFIKVTDGIYRTIQTDYSTKYKIVHRLRMNRNILLPN